MNRSLVLGIAAMVFGGGLAIADAKLERVAARLEYNKTDGDFEIVFEATGGDLGLTALKVAAPDGRIVLEFTAKNTRLGIRTFRFETPEPKSMEILQGEYPAGVYTFTANTTAGTTLTSTAKLSHELPPAAVIRRPLAGESQVPVKGLRVKWRAEKPANAYLLTIENDHTGVKVVQATLAANVTSFAVPDGVLAPGTNYKISIGTQQVEGNATFVESTFRTVKK